MLMKKGMALIFIFIMCMGLVSCNTPEAEKTPFKFCYTVYSQKYDSDYLYISKEEFQTLTQEQQNALRGIYNEIGRQWWQEKYILGEIDETERLDLETAKSILERYDEKTDIKIILEEFAKIQKYPDYSGGSGFTSIHFWIKNQPFDRAGAIVLYVMNHFVVIRYYDENGEQTSAESYGFSNEDDYLLS